MVARSSFLFGKFFRRPCTAGQNPWRCRQFCREVLVSATVYLWCQHVGGDSVSVLLRVVAHQVRRDWKRGQTPTRGEIETEYGQSRVPRPADGWRSREFSEVPARHHRYVRRAKCALSFAGHFRVNAVHTVTCRGACKAQRYFT